MDTEAQREHIDTVFHIHQKQPDISEETISNKLSEKVKIEVEEASRFVKWYLKLLKEKDTKLKPKIKSLRFNEKVEHIESDGRAVKDVALQDKNGSTLSEYTITREKLYGKYMLDRDEIWLHYNAKVVGDKRPYWR